VGWDKNRLTERQREKKNPNNNIDIKNLQRVMFSPLNAQLASE